MRFAKIWSAMEDWHRHQRDELVTLETTWNGMTLTLGQDRDNVFWCVSSGEKIVREHSACGFDTLAKAQADLVKFCERMNWAVVASTVRDLYLSGWVKDE